MVAVFSRMMFAPENAFGPAEASVTPWPVIDPAISIATCPSGEPAPIETKPPEAERVLSAWSVIDAEVSLKPSAMVSDPSVEMLAPIAITAPTAEIDEAPVAVMAPPMLTGPKLSVKLKLPALTVPFSCRPFSPDRLTTPGAESGAPLSVVIVPASAFRLIPAAAVVEVIGAETSILPSELWKLSAGVTAVAPKTVVAPLEIAPLAVIARLPPTVSWPAVSISPLAWTVRSPCTEFTPDRVTVPP